MSRVGGSNFRFEWHGDEFSAAVRESMADGLEVGAMVLRDQMVRTTTNPSPSKPGKPPGVVTGILSASMTTNANRPALSAKVGTPWDYGRFLEYGTRRMAARPWVLRSYALAKSKINAKMIEYASKSLARRIVGKAGAA